MQSLDQQAHSLATILDLSRLVCSSLDLDVVLDRIIDAVHDLSGADLISIMLVDEQGEYLHIVGSRGLAPEQVAAPAFRVGEGVAGWVAQHGVPVHSADLSGDKRYVPVYTPQAATLFALPLRVRERTLGVLNLARVAGGALFSSEIVQMVEIFASHAAIAIDNVSAATALKRMVVQEQQSRALSRTLSQLAAACNALVGQEILLDFILEQLARFIAYDSSGVFLFHDNHYARMVAGHGFRQARAGVVLYMGPGSIMWEVCRQHQALCLPDVQEVAGWQEVPDSELVRAWIGAPLVVNDVVIGMLTIDKWSPAAFGDADVQVAQLFADHVAVAINNQRLLRDAQIRASQLQLLHQLSVRLGTMREVRPLLDEVARLLHTAFGYYQILVGTLDEGEIVPHAAYGTVNALSDLAVQPYGAERGLTGYVVRTGETVLVNDVSRDARYIAHPQLAATAAELVAPIQRNGRVLGVIVIDSEQTGAFGQHDVSLVESIAAQTALALDHISHDEELRRTEERLAHSERLRALGELASGVAHDFNNLLASILGHTQLLLGQPHAPRLVEELRVIERAALDGAASVRRLQGFAQTNRSLPAEPVDLGEIIVESLAITRPRWRDGPQSRGVAIRVDRDLGAIPPFGGDGPALRDLVTNLVLNAIDAMPGGGTLRLRTLCLEATVSPLGQPTALLEVSDTGMGMSTEVQDHIFDPFFTTKGPQGTGMGLAMVYGIVQRHQGLISVASEPGSGTSFSIYLPARPPALSAAKPEIEPPATEALRILVVEDDEAVRRVLVRQIRRLGHSVAEAVSGEVAMEALASASFDLICTDLGMPGMSGWELINRARKLDDTIRTVLVTGWGEQIDPDEARARGADAVIAKPFDTQHLQQVIAGLSMQSRR
ncbi:MAG: GAF domain-containing protein [Chloroflexales bacterium]|nr:GAF domain-containing protein [Chloroflexales bacterium]